MVWSVSFFWPPSWMLRLICLALDHEDVWEDRYARLSICRYCGKRLR